MDTIETSRMAQDSSPLLITAPTLSRRGEDLVTLATWEEVEPVPQPGETHIGTSFRADSLAHEYVERQDLS